MRKLLILPGGFHRIGGTIISLLLLAKGFEKCGFLEQLCVLMWSGTPTEKCMREAGYGSCLQLIEATDHSHLMKHALQWVSEQPRDWPLLLDNCVDKNLIPLLTLAAPALRLSGRPLYHFCHDLALSHNPLGFVTRKIAFSSLSPKAICNSQFTAGYIRRLIRDIQGILYQPVDLERFNEKPPTGSVPFGLEPIISSGARIMLTPSRINKPRIINDKNLRSLIPVLAHLKAMGHFYHGVVIGQDTSADQSHSRALLESAASAGVADRFTILPLNLNIEEYYKYADIVVTLAPREPFGRTVVEAIASGVPVIGSCTGGIWEILHNFAPEWTVNPDDPVAAAENIIRVANDPSTKDRLVKGRNWVETHCSVESYAKGMMQLTGLIPAT